jgi:hypothetical protein
VAASHRLIPPSVKVQAGARTATFPVNTDEVSAPQDLTISGAYGAHHAAILTVVP